MSKRALKIMKLFKLASEEIASEGILIDKESFLQKLKGADKGQPVKVEPITVQV
jgi:hypothetical protein